MNLFPQTIDVKIQVKSGNLIQDTQQYIAMPFLGVISQPIL